MAPPNGACAISGHLLAGDGLRPLPFGAQVKDGAFYGQPGVGFVGTYDFVSTGGCTPGQTPTLRVILGGAR